MAVIAPFRGLRYNPELVKDLSLVVAPPYDVISPESQQAFHALHRQNVIRLILGEVCEGDDTERNRYRRAGDYFRRWQAEKVLVRDPAPAIYLYQQIFQAPGGRELARRGLIALVRLEEFGGRTVFPHERTMAAAKEDRLRLMQSCHANLSPIFGIYPGSLLEVDRLFISEEEREAPIDLRDRDGIRHRVWTLEDGAKINAVRDAFESTPIFIADGHHRYETALAFRDLMRAKDRGDPSAKETRPYNYIMMTLVSAGDPGLIILPIHRLLRQLPGAGLDAYVSQVSQQFRVERVPLPIDPEAGASVILGRLQATRSGRHRFGLYVGGESAYVLTLADERIVEAEVAEGNPAAYKRLDVTILHALLIDGPLRRQGQAILPDDALVYTHDAVEAIRMVQHGGWGAAFFLNPTKIAEVQAVAGAGLRMPPKSTFFYPKLLTGLVIHPILLDEVVEA
ncbi:MAG: DUF1015 domain-containing protein [Candidatus Methylomirabilis oxyfera]|nr:DUF1015 domain-containing protein [Candidatus Methylomirabilis oxyfera]